MGDFGTSNRVQQASHPYRDDPNSKSVSLPAVLEGSAFLGSNLTADKGKGRSTSDPSGKQYAQASAPVDPSVFLSAPLQLQLPSSASSGQIASTSLSPSISETSLHGTITSRSGRRRFVCTHPDCDKSFSTSGHLARHTRAHTGEKHFQCTYPGCESRFSRHDNMLQHYRNHIVRNARRKRTVFAEAVGGVKTSSLAGVVRDSSAGSSSGNLTPPVASGSPVSGGTIHEELSAKKASSTAGTGSKGRKSKRSGVSPVRRRGPSRSTLQSSGDASSTQVPQAAARPTQLSLSFGYLQPFSQDSSIAIIDGIANGPPLASPDAIERPHSATGMATAAGIIPGHLEIAPVAAAIPTLTHRHSYSTLPKMMSIPSQQLDPVTPASELTSYPYPYHPTSPLEIQGNVYSPSPTDPSYPPHQSYFAQTPSLYPANAPSGSMQLAHSRTPSVASVVTESDHYLQAQVQPALGQGPLREHVYQQEAPPHLNLEYRNPLLSGVMTAEHGHMSHPSSQAPISYASSSDGLIVTERNTSSASGSDGMALPNRTSSTGSAPEIISTPAPAWLRMRPEEHVWQPQLSWHHNQMSTVPQTEHQTFAYTIPDHASQVYQQEQLQQQQQQLQQPPYHHERDQYLHGGPQFIQLQGDRAFHPQAQRTIYQQQHMQSPIHHDVLQHQLQTQAQPQPQHQHQIQHQQQHYQQQQQHPPPTPFSRHPHWQGYQA